MSAPIYPAVPPALPPERRRARIEHLPVFAWSEADRAYAEARDLAEAYPDCLADILEGLIDGLRAGRGQP